MTKKTDMLKSSVSEALEMVDDLLTLLQRIKAYGTFEQIHQDILDTVHEVNQKKARLIHRLGKDLPKPTITH